MRGLDGSIVKLRRSRKNYGSMLSTQFQPGRGWDAHTYWETSDECYVVGEHLKWYITRVAAPLLPLPRPPPSFPPHGQGRG